MRWAGLLIAMACAPAHDEPLLVPEPEPVDVPQPTEQPEVIVEALEDAAPDCSLCDPNGGHFGYGSGDIDDPAMICSVSHLDALRVRSDARAVLCADIHMGDFTPLPLFSGVLDGQGHTLHGWTVDAPETSDIGFIHALRGGVLRNLNFADVSIRAYSGVAVAVHHTVEDSHARIVDVHVEGSLSTTSGHVAGVVGSVAAGTEVVGASFSGEIDNAEFGYVAGVVDRCAGSCRKLVAEGTLTTNAWKAGCVAQTVTGLLEGAICRMDMSVRNRSGGIAGELLGGTIRASYFEGRMEGDYWLGGIVGEVWDDDGILEQTWAAGEIVSHREHSGVGAAGVVAWPGSHPHLVDVLWDRDRGPQHDTAGGRALATHEMQDPQHEAFATWSNWDHTPGDYPRLPWE